MAVFHRTSCTLILNLCLVSLAFSSSVETQESFADYVAIRAKSKSQEALQLVLQEYGDSSECVTLKEPSKIRPDLDIACRASVVNDELLDFFQNNEIEHEVLRTGLDQPKSVNLTSRNVIDFSTGGLDFFPRFDEIVTYLEQLRDENPDFVTLKKVGESEQGRDLYVLALGTKPRGRQTRLVWIDATAHAREWLSPTTTLYVINQLVEQFQTYRGTQYGDPTRPAEVDVMWLIMPVLNPDGYEYSHTNKRLWRKNRRDNGGSCKGVDLNRNWDVVGYGIGASGNKCSDVYKGPSRASEPEVKTAQDLIMKYKNNIRTALSIHSYGQLWLTSWGYTTVLPPDHNALTAWGNRCADAIRGVNGRDYSVVPAFALGIIGGASDDFAKAEGEVPFVATVELPDTGNFGFVAPPEAINEVGAEIWAAMQVVAEDTRDHELGAVPAGTFSKRNSVMEEINLDHLEDDGIFYS